MKSLFKKPVFFLSAKRSPFGGFLGSLSRISAIDLGVHAAKAALAASGLGVEVIDQVIFGNVLQTSKDAIYLARHIGLKAGLPLKSPALTVNRLCGSGFEAIIQGARLIATKEARCVLVGGTENMSQAPHVVRDARLGLKLKSSAFEDSLWESFYDSYAQMPMGLTAEKLGELYKLSAEEVDHYALRSQRHYQEALLLGHFADEIAPIVYHPKKEALSHDEHPRSDASLEAFARLPKVFKNDGLIHAGAASGIADGAAALIMCSEDFLQEHQLKPLGELLSYGVTACDPSIMGIGPVSAIKSALEKISVELADIDMIEVNEAFAPQVLAVKKALEIDLDKLNIHGGAIALGHPLAASGARIASHLLHALKSKSRLGLGSACIGGGQGIALVIQSL